MNAKIKELLSELDPVARIGNWGRVEWADNVYPQLGDKMYAATDLEKFAELIVQECIEQLNISNVPALISAGLNLGRVAIREHFGVEE